MAPRLCRYLEIKTTQEISAKTIQQEAEIQKKVFITKGGHSLLLSYRFKLWLQQRLIIAVSGP